MSDYSKLPQHIKENIDKTFLRDDIDGDGYITVDEFKKAMQQLIN